MPWKGEKNPYKVWLSEVILQQTRVGQGWSYYEKFVEAFPHVQALATAPEDKVLKLWEGLGYYSRARNLHQTAKAIVQDFNGIFPDTYEGLLQLKGIGPYTASAIASFAFDQPNAVVDGNVYRVLSRVFGIDSPIDTTAGQKTFRNLAGELLSNHPPAAYNQAIIDLGATVCLPAKPKCKECPLRQNCEALRTNSIPSLPVKLKRIEKKARYFNYLYFRDSSPTTLIRKRVGKDIWQGLYEFPMLETSYQIETDQLLQLLAPEIKDITAQSLAAIITLPRQLLTHQAIYGKVWVISRKRKPKQGEIAVRIEDLTNFAFPKLLSTFINRGSVNLELF